MFRWAWMKICSLDFLSSRRISLNPPPPLELLDLTVDMVALAGKSYGGFATPL